MARTTIPTGRAFSQEGAAEAWRKAAAGRAAYLRVPAARMFALAALKPGARVLVIGGGTGDEAIEAARRVGAGGEVVHTDLSPGMVREAAKAVAEAGFGRLRCVVMDAQELAFPDAGFDAVIARNVLMFIPDLQRGLSEMRRVLRPGGRLVGTTWASGDRNPRMSIPLAAARSVGLVVPPDTALSLALGLSRPDRLRAAIRRAGFRRAEVERAPASARPQDWTPYLTDIRQHVGAKEIADLLPERDRDRFWRSVERRVTRLRATGQLRGEQLVICATA